MICDYPADFLQCQGDSERERKRKDKKKITRYNLCAKNANKSIAKTVSEINPDKSCQKLLLLLCKNSGYNVLLMMFIIVTFLAQKQQRSGFCCLSKKSDEYRGIFQKISLWLQNFGK